MFDCRCIKCRQQLQIDEFDKVGNQWADALRDYAKMANDEVPAAAVCLLYACCMPVRDRCRIAMTTHSKH